MKWFRRRPFPSRVTEPSQKRRFAWLGGRRYLAELPYMLPKDEGEISRLDFQHFLLRQAFQGNYLAPIVRPISILDSGCGTGRWAMEMAAQFSYANVVGLDLAPPSADERTSLGHGLDRRPDNYTYVQGNIFDGLPFADGSFEFVHQRLLYAAIPADRWPGVVRELARVTTPGGWVELVEGGMVIGEGDALRSLTQWGSDACARRGIDLQVGKQIDTLLQRVGLQRVTMRQVTLPVGPHGGHLGQMVATDLLAIFQTLRGPVVAAGIVDEATYERAVAGLRDEIHACRYVWPFYGAYGQRPL